MSYALNLDNQFRILSATYEAFAAPGQPIVDELPEGDVSDYCYINGEYVCDPLPKPDTAIRASNNYEAGAVFAENGELYRATESISRNERIIPGANCETISIADALNALNKEE